MCSSTDRSAFKKRNARHLRAAAICRNWNAANRINLIDINVVCDFLKVRESSNVGAHYIFNVNPFGANNTLSLLPSHAIP